MQNDNFSQKQKLDRLEEQKRWADALFKNSSSAIAMLDSKHRILDINREFTRKFGYKLEEIEGQNLDEVLEKEGKPQSVDKTMSRKVMTGDKTRSIGIRYSKQGKAGKYIIKGVPITVNGDIVGIYAIYEDITELQQTKNKLRATLNSIGDAVISTDEKGHVTRMNSVTETLTGWNFVRAKGKPLSEIFNIVNTRTRERVKNPAERVLETGKKVGLANHTMLISRDGNEYQIADTASPIRDEKGEIIGVVIVFRDITEEYRMREELKSREERLKYILKGTDAGTWEWNIQTGEIKVNEKWAEMVGYSREEISPLSIETWKELTHPNDLEKSEEMLQKHFRGEIEQYEMECRLKHKQGHWIWVLDRGRIISRTESGKPLCMFGTQLNVTAQKQREEKIRYISYHDSVTDLYNRTYMERKLKKIVTKNQLPLGIIMTDINGLKLINEAYGHKKGDRVLRQAANLLTACVFEENIIARWAGDKFIIILPGTGLKVTEKIVKRIKDRCIKSAETENIPISLGVGYAVKTEQEGDIYDILHRAEDRLYRDKLTINRSSKNRLVENMLNTLGAKSDETRDHARRMTDLSKKLGKKLGLRSEQLNNLSLLATLHDIGKVNIAEELLNKSGSLTDKEWEAVREHTEKGYSIAISIEEFTPIAESILSHHERWDGDGYPQGIKGKDIPLLARIISIVDAYDVMTNGRPYKEPMTVEEAISELRRCAGGQFDPELVEVFVAIVSEGDETQD